MKLSTISAGLFRAAKLRLLPARSAVAPMLGPTQDIRKNFDEPDVTWLRFRPTILDQLRWWPPRSVREKVDP